MNIFKKDFKDNLKSALIWTISAALMGFIVLSIYDSTIAESKEQWNKLAEILPKKMLDAFDFNEFTFNNVLSYYAVKGYLFVNLILVIYASLLGVKLINKEETDKTIEFALTKPISRFSYLSQKLGTLITIITLFNLLTGFILYLGLLVGTSDPINYKGFILYLTGTYLLTITFGLISFAIACAVKRTKGLSGLAIGIVFLSFFIGIISKLSETFAGLKYISLFQYIDPIELLDNGLPLLSIVVFIIIIITTIVISYLSYLKKDIYT